MSLIIDIHALQTVPPSLINRDDTGAPKTAVFGGVPRQRVSSQSWKRAIRKYFEDHFDSDQIGDRSKRLPEKIAKRLEEVAGLEQAEAIERVQKLFKAAKISTEVEKAQKKTDDPDAAHNPYPHTKYLFFLSPAQVDHAVQVLGEDWEGKISKKDAQSVLDEDHSVDMAMFGRMVADDAAYNVDAAVQVAHALGVHASAPEFDFYTAVDDLAEEGEETGAGMLGTVQMMSSTMYRYATVNVDGLAQNLDSPATARDAAVKFIEAFVSSMPTGKINTFANQTLPELLYVAVRDTRPVSLVNAFESPVTGTESDDRRHESARRLADEARNVQDAYGFTPNSSYVLALGDLADAFDGIAEKVTLAELTDKLQGDLDRAMGDE
ncbi:MULTISPECIES: type I-E CRISPR-associated protein Cas7/Cse4/CasC [Corynebacterium]|uniref:Type I-E CRISPR-associated protein Cas7/Cse4/CasC n=2 Tax=Corynebacterium TaxID=1716 RepID=A0AB36RJN6_9CORY|nr:MULTISPECIES: type I-E CRISPR-associated protein Cas7/Cse4/CasC [Corynebacterium]PAT09635.1 type I-E CRISPR-associated protein Cas7/Cse4/CasC [Corynebacterium hadale]RMD18344.1 type I-E CRISPR-associated protein Cas7/Cse4/CasC [Corynebacterium gottingense]WJZ14185.1 CRISPR system Cascade subunit CasC [Corynebacterium gottingense]